VRTEIERMLLKLAEEEAAASYKQLEADVEHKKISHKAQLRILQFTTDRHKRHFNRHANDLNRSKIKAPMDGLVVIQQIYRGGGESQQVAEGDAVFPGQLVMKIVNPASMQIEGSVNQSESGDFRVGQKATIGLDAFPGAKFDGTIFSIGALAVGGFRQNYYIRTVPVRVAVKGADSRMIPDLSASMDIAVDEMKDATLLPLGAVREQDGKFLVEVKGPQGFVTREVKLGIRSHTHVAVLEGLKPDEEVRLL
jgi:HlyD family secretion protein